MYTVAELIETLKQCPQDYKVSVFSLYEGTGFIVEQLGIDHDEKTVTLFD
jgi:hypothetical protein